MSITHHHICAVLHTELANPLPTPLRVLDVGSGNGRLIAQIMRRMPLLRPGCDVEVHGFDVTDSDIQQEGFFDGALAHLGEQHPHVDWSARLTRIASSDPWPYPDAHFDAVTSNQVIEHVRDHDFVFSEIARVLSVGGFSVNVFPLQSCVMEWHVNVPFAHWTNDPSRAARRIKAWNSCGVGKYRKHRAKDPSLTLDRYATTAADRMLAETNYKTRRELRDCARRHGLGCTFCYSGGMYANRVRMLCGRPLRYRYRKGAWERMTLRLYSALASVTMILSKD